MDTKKITEKKTPENKGAEKKAPLYKKPLRYLREVSVVIIGVAVTFLGSDWINSRNDREDLDRYLAAMRIELEGNLADVRENLELYHRTAVLTRLLWSAPHRDLPVDTLNQYTDVIPVLLYPNFRTSALETLKTSGLMRLIPDELLWSIQESYNQLEEVRFDSHQYMEIKMRELYESIFSDTEYGSLKLFAPQNRRVLHFLMTQVTLETGFRTCAAQIEDTLRLIAAH